MPTWIYRPNHPLANENGMVEKAAVYDDGPRAAVPYVISDTMAPLKHMGTGEILDSKAKFRQATRASGCVEIGNEAIKPRKSIELDRGKRRDDIRRAIYELRNSR